MTRGYEGRPLKYPINIVRGEAGGFTVTFYETDGVTARNMSAVTFAPIIFTRGDPDPTLVTLSQSLGGAGSNVLSLSWTDVQATSLAKGQRLDWRLGTSTAVSWVRSLGGPVNVFEQGEATGAASGDLTITTESLVLTLSSQAPDIAAFDSRYALGTPTVTSGGTTALADVNYQTEIGARANGLEPLDGRIYWVEFCNGPLDHAS
jgi:hypothetical protein